MSRDLNDEFTHFALAPLAWIVGLAAGIGMALYTLLLLPRNLRRESIADKLLLLVFAAFIAYNCIF